MVEKGGHDGRAIANYMLQFAMGRDIPLTNLQLQKIIFFAHGTYLTQFNSPLVINRFEAWEHGPVIPELYHALKQYGDRNIKSAVTRYDLESRIHDTARLWSGDERATLRACIQYRENRRPGWTLSWLREFAAHVFGGELSERVLKQAIDLNVPPKARTGFV